MLTCTYAAAYAFLSWQHPAVSVQLAFFISHKSVVRLPCPDVLVDQTLDVTI